MQRDKVDLALNNLELLIGLVIYEKLGSYSLWGSTGTSNSEL